MAQKVRASFVVLSVQGSRSDQNIYSSAIKNILTITQLKQDRAKSNLNIKSFRQKYMKEIKPKCFSPSHHHQLTPVDLEALDPPAEYSKRMRLKRKRTSSHCMITNITYNYHPYAKGIRSRSPKKGGENKVKELTSCFENKTLLLICHRELYQFNFNAYYRTLCSMTPIES